MYTFLDFVFLLLTKQGKCQYNDGNMITISIRRLVRNYKEVAEQVKNKKEEMVVFMNDKPMFVLSPIPEGLIKDISEGQEKLFSDEPTAEELGLPSNNESDEPPF